MRLIIALLLAFAACHPQPTKPKPDEIPPLPPASGTAIGYLVDAQSELKLRDDQLKKLKDLDSSLAARNGEIDAQLRQIEKPAPEEELSPKQVKNGEKAKRYNNAPGANTMTTNDSMKLRKIRDDNDRDALKKAFALLDPDQVTTAKRILTDRGIEIPGETKKEEQRGSDEGTPLPGMEP